VQLIKHPESDDTVPAASVFNGQRLADMSIEGTLPTSEKMPNSPRAAKLAFVKHYGSTTIGQGLLLGLGTLTGILAARMLGPSGRGEYAAIIIWPMAIVGLVALGINQAITFNIGRRAFTVSEVATAVSSIGLIQGAVSVVVGLIAVHFALAKYSPTVQHLGSIFALFTPVLILSGNPANLFQGMQDPLRFNIIRVAPALTYLVGLVGLYFTHHANLTSVIFFQLLGYVVTLVLGVTMVWHILKPRWQWNALTIPSLIHFGFRAQATNLTNYFNQRIDQLVLSLFVPPQQLGFYVVAVTLSTVVTVFPQAAGIVTFARGSGQHLEDAKATIGHSFRASLIWLLICGSLLYMLCPMLIRLVFGGAFSGSILACRILLPGALMIGLNQVLYNGASALGRPGLPSCAEGASMAVTAIGLYLLVPRYGYIGAAIVSSVAYTFSFLLMLGLSHRLLGLKFRDLLVRGKDSPPTLMGVLK
jgi:O-antigen/teichoic acid export membrane protein